VKKSLILWDVSGAAAPRVFLTRMAGGGHDGPPVADILDGGPEAGHARAGASSWPKVITISLPLA
jgi:hypothetical protein